MGANLQLGGALGSRRARRRSARPMSEINVTPFVDVMLVLLIIFMVAAPLLTVGVPLELPKSEANALPTEKEEPLTINLDAGRKIYIQKTEVPAEELVPKLAAIQAELRPVVRVVASVHLVVVDDAIVVPDLDAEGVRLPAAEQIPVGGGELGVLGHQSRSQDL